MSSINSSQRVAQEKSTIKDYPPLIVHEEEVLIVVKTAPHPSISYREIVCTAGVTVSGKWIRLYPISFRYLNFFQWFRKYQWIRVKVEKNSKDQRIDSYRPVMKSIRPIGKPLSTRENWLERKKILLPTLSQSLDEIKANFDRYRISLGIFKPKEVSKLIIEPVDKELSNNHKKVINQQVLFLKQPKELEKIPYRFRYVFRCNDKQCKGHTLQITDWEIYELYRKLKNKYNYDIDKILEDIKKKWLYEFWRGNLDSYLIVGTSHPYHTFIVLGVFRPKKERSLTLFD